MPPAIRSSAWLGLGSARCGADSGSIEIIPEGWSARPFAATLPALEPLGRGGTATFLGGELEPRAVVGGAERRPRAVEGPTPGDGGAFSRTIPTTMGVGVISGEGERTTAEGAAVSLPCRVAPLPGGLGDSTKRAFSRRTIESASALRPSSRLRAFSECRASPTGATPSFLPQVR